MMMATTVVQVTAGKNSYSQTGDEVVILGVETGKYYSLNPVGAAFWAMIQEPVAIRAAATSISAEFDAPVEVIEADLVELATQLVEAELVHEVPPAGA